ncbi:TfoX/Sxy family protein [Desulfitobacterium sp.]|uniref:TfoX/Sxy family protein n=1 Tax=Desulfitobacterium sp. TaxID=49981 RepID=UPI002C7992CD|nr:TfoX/Sxy family protein [Desulfitobacterium sp.]HVJ47892.1 TfoX/Sxy family protein [Desulfitobacterium sp.]
MAVSESFKDYVLDQLELFGSVTIKKMFGGAGIYHDGLIFGLLADDVLYFKVDDSNRSDYEQAEMEPYRPSFVNKPMSMPYYEVPADIIEDNKRLVDWARKALLASNNKPSKLPKSKKSSK